MEYLTMHTPNLVDENIQKIGELFPNCLTETKDENGKVVPAIDFDLLRQELSHEIVEGYEERYRFEWPDKRNAILNANSPTTATLRPCRSESVDFDRTRNLYIEGDNLEVLKLLRETYLGKVKMIYIDPPYNTGNDFVYEDDFALSTEKYIAGSGQFDEEQNRMVHNAESNGRFHTDWLNMIYPRLKVARDLLADDGIIFISIDDGELDNLKKICDEIFGAGNFVDIFNWAKTETPENLSKKSKQIIEYVLCYEKNKDSVKLHGIKKESVSSNGLLNQPNKINTLVFPAGIVSTSIKDGIIPAGMYGTDKYDVELLEDTEVENGVFIRDVVLRAKFKWSQKNLNEEIGRGTIIRIPKMTFSPSYEKREYDAEVPSNLINSKVSVSTNEVAGEYQLKLFSKKVFNYPKPVSLIKYLAGFKDDGNEMIVMDFFSGSATTAEAVFEMNTNERSGSIKFILVQIQEDLYDSLTHAKSNSAKEICQNAIDFCKEHKLPTNLCEIAKERIRRAGKKIKDDNKDKPDIDKLDTGFRVLKLDSSNMEDVFYTPDKFDADKLFIDNVKPDRTPEDLLFQVMLMLGIELSASIVERTIGGKKVFSVMNDYLIACFDSNIDESVITEIAKLKPMHFVMRDNSMASDNVADNFEQIFRTYSDSTKRFIL